MSNSINENSILWGRGYDEGYHDGIEKMRDAACSLPSVGLDGVLEKQVIEKAKKLLDEIYPDPLPRKPKPPKLQYVTEGQDLRKKGKKQTCLKKNR